MRGPALAVVSLAFLATACQPATTELTEEQKAEIETAVRQVDLDFQTTWQAREDIDAYMSYVFDWSSISPFGDESVDNLRTRVLAFWGAQATVTFDRSEPRVLVLGPDAAGIEGTNVRVATDTAGVTRERTSIFRRIWIRQNGEWKLFAGTGFARTREP